jgi:hypothetical protein
MTVESAIALRFMLCLTESSPFVIDRCHRRAALTAFLLFLLCGVSPLHAATITLNGATFEAPAGCQLAEGAIVCKVDSQQLELWVRRTPLSMRLLPNAPTERKSSYFNELHADAVKNVMRSTGNDQSTAFSAYGNYPALGAAMPGKGVVTSPTVRFASVLHEDEVWEFIEVVATRTPVIEAVSADLQRGLKLPLSATAASVKVATEVTPTASTYTGKWLSFQYPLFLQAVVTEDDANGATLGFKHNARDSGPNVTISLRAPKDKATTAAVAINARKQASLNAMAEGSSATVEVNKLGSISGAGYALIGTPDAKKGFSGIESIETAFVAAVGDRLLEVRLTAEQKYSKDMEAVWALLSSSLKFVK